MRCRPDGDIALEGDRLVTLNQHARGVLAHV
jgi:hypothetical protein